MTIYVDATHVRGRITGIERITAELFSPQILSPLPVESLTATDAFDMVVGQQARLAASLAKKPSSLLICPGFPPALTLFPFRNRVIPYIHDTFLISRWSDLNIRAKLYMALPFRIAVSSYKAFLVNSQTTKVALQALCRDDADIMLYRPEVRDVFGADARRERNPDSTKLELVAIGTVEPRKNYPAAARIVQALRQRGVDATLTIAGRRGWGNDWDILQSMPGVKLLGYSSNEEVRAALQAADLLITTSHDEGLGLPLLEAQHANLGIVAPDKPVFREVLGNSGIMIDPSDVSAAADCILSTLRAPDWRVTAAMAAQRNLARWNDAAARDRENIIAYLARLLQHDRSKSID